MNAHQHSTHPRGQAWTILTEAWTARRDVSLQGVLRAPAIEVPVGVRLTLSEALLLESEGPIELAELPRLAFKRRPWDPVLLVLRAAGDVVIGDRRYRGPVEVILAPPGPDEHGLPTLAVSRSARDMGLEAPDD